MTEERNQRIAAENREKDQNKRMQRQIRDMKEETAELSKKEAEASRKKHELVRLRMLGDLIRFTDEFTLEEVTALLLCCDLFTRKWTSRA